MTTEERLANLERELAETRKELADLRVELAAGLTTRHIEVVGEAGRGRGYAGDGPVQRGGPESGDAGGDPRSNARW